MIAKSAMAVVVSRCGYDITKLFNANDFQDVTMFDSSKTTLALGSATLNTAKEILNVISYSINKEIEKEKSYERNKENSQWNRLYSGQGRDLVSGPSTSGVRVEQLGSSKERLLEEQRRDAIRRMMMTGEILQHLETVQTQAQERYETLIEQKRKALGVTEELKEKDWLKWVQLANSIQEEARQEVLEEMIYI